MISFLQIVIEELFVFITLKLDSNFIHKKGLAFQNREKSAKTRQNFYQDSIMNNYLWDLSLQLNSATKYYSYPFKRVIFTVMRLHK